ncbi:hypothetical protein M885DRAFT_535387 [Pelagophyceae sp. CCMP2097]|nr:hypothetical protein M885DRAFT_535387 [Pelagophyceae sp. CCMP2097]
MWRGAVRLWHLEHLGKTASHFGKPEFWREAYAAGKAAKEWFVEAATAADGAVDVYSAQRPVKKRNLQVLHVGCGISTLGSEVVSAFERSHAAPSISEVHNVDVSEEALGQLEQAQALLPGASQQRYALWDASSGKAPEGGPFDLVLDKGALDALQFAGAESLIAFFAALRPLLQDGACMVHWSDEEPESRFELLKAAFPRSESFRVSWSLEEAPDGPRLCSDLDFYRYVVSHDRTEGAQTGTVS